MRYGLYYYGYRYYAPELQRWLSRDPLGEWVALNLYNFVLNAPFISIDPFGLLHWTDLIPDFLVDPKVVNFCAGMADYLTFDITNGARTLLKINDPVDPCSGAYKWGSRVGAVVDVGLSGTSLALKQAAKAVTKAEMSAIRTQARRLLAEEIEELEKLGMGELQSHHWLPLKGHPIGVRTPIEKFLKIRWDHTLFPTAGLPECVRNSRWNLRIVNRELHIRLHMRMKTWEMIGYMGFGIANPFYTGFRIQFQSEREAIWRGW